MSSLRTVLLTTLLATSTSFTPTPTSTSIHHPRSLTTALPVAVDTSDIKNGLTIELPDGEPYKVLSFSIMKQARGAAKTTIKFKNLKRGTTIENTYRSGEKFETAEILRKPSQYTYEDDVRWFMWDRWWLCDSVRFLCDFGIFWLGMDFGVWL